MSAPGAPLSSEGVHALDQLRQRLNQMSTSLGSLKADLERPDTLPTRSSIQSSAQILSHNLGQLMATISTHDAFLTAAHAYPLTSFPGQTKEALLNQLLRKRLEPQAEDWLKKHESADSLPPQVLDRADLRQLWSIAGEQSHAIEQSLTEDGAFDDDFTLEEREGGPENVRTGLRRSLLDGDEDHDMQDSDGPVTTKPPLSLDVILKTMSTGRPP